MEQVEKDIAIWIEYRTNEYERGINLDYIKARRDLYGKISNSFDPFLSESPFLRGQHVTIAGIRKYLPEHPIGLRIDELVAYVRDKLFKSENFHNLDVSSCSKDLNIPTWQVSTMLFLLSSSGTFWDQTNGNGREIFNFFIQSKEAVREYLNYSNFDQLNLRRPRHPIIEQVDEEKEEVLITRSKKKGSVFIIMPMARNKPEYDDVKNTIKEAVLKFNLNAFRVDDIEHSETITKKVLESIRESEFIVADLTDIRPNVYYEIGYAHALGHHPILVRKLGTELHFDLSVHNALEYKNNTELKDIIIKRFESILGRKVE